jgi:hypothetical protein
VNYRALAQRLSIVMMESGLCNQKRCTYLYICTLLQRLCRPASIYIMLTPMCRLLPNRSSKTQRRYETVRRSATSGYVPERGKRYRQVTRFGTERSNCANAIARLPRSLGKRRQRLFEIPSELRSFAKLCEWNTNL